MDGLEAARQFTAAVPFARILGVEFNEVGAERVVATMPYVADRTNHVHTVHAAAEFGLGETATGVLVFFAFQEALSQGFVPVVANASIGYKRPAPGDLKAVATLSAEARTQALAQLASDGQARVTVLVALTNADGKSACEMSTEWALIKPRS
jgi:uncharacterized protein (TIGR00369 family)